MAEVNQSPDEALLYFVDQDLAKKQKAFLLRFLNGVFLFVRVLVLAGSTSKLTHHFRHHIPKLFFFLMQRRTTYRVFQLILTDFEDLGDQLKTTFI